MLAGSEVEQIKEKKICAGIHNKNEIRIQKIFVERKFVENNFFFFFQYIQRPSITSFSFL